VRRIDLDRYPRRALYEAFKDREVPFFSVTAHVDITAFKRHTRERGLGFFIPLSYLLTRAVNAVPEFRHRIVDGELVEFDAVDPGFTVLLDDRTFSFCDARHFADFPAYREHAAAMIREVRERPDRATGEKHGMFFISNLPWFSFTAITHPYSRQYASIPVIAIGRYFRRDGGLAVPIGVQVHHGLVDGLHVGEFYQTLESFCREPETALA
jgi:chloramphenicol O-acetyltransferase type A